MRCLIALFLVVGLAPVFAVVETFEFRDDAQRQRYHRFIEELRCPKCQNQNLAGSDAPIARDLRHQLQRQLSEGQSDEQIVEFMVSRYGDYILYRPRLQPKTVMLWFAPAVLLLLAVGLVLRTQRRRRPIPAAEQQSLSSDDQKRLQRMLETRPGTQR